MILPMEEIPDDGTEGLRRRRRSTTGSHYVLSLSTVKLILQFICQNMHLILQHFLDERTNENRPHLHRCRSDGAYRSWELPSICPMRKQQNVPKTWE